MFVAPVLYLLHAIMAGCAFMITNFFNIKMGGSFSHGLIDYALSFSIGTKPLWILGFGALYAVLYYTVFTAAIRLFNLKTPGREDEDETANNNEIGSQLAYDLFVAFGGSKNIKNIDACITRLRITVHNTELVDVEAIKGLGATAVLVVGQNMQAIFGPRSDQIKTEMNELLQSNQAPETAPVLVTA